MPEREPTFQVDDPQGEERLRELILYVADACADDHRFGATKLNKILWWSDFLAFAQEGKPITGVEYQRLGNGPAPRRLVPVRQHLLERQDAVMSRVQTLGGYVQQRLIPLRTANLAVFTPGQIDLVNRVINALWHKTATGVNSLSHGKAWEVAADLCGADMGRGVGTSRRQPCMAGLRVVPPATVCGLLGDGRFSRWLDVLRRTGLVRAPSAETDVAVRARCGVAVAALGASVWGVRCD